MSLNTFLLLLFLLKSCFSSPIDQHLRKEEEKNQNQTLSTKEDKLNDGAKENFTTEKNVNVILDTNSSVNSTNDDKINFTNDKFEGNSTLQEDYLQPESDFAYGEDSGGSEVVLNFQGHNPVGGTGVGGNWDNRFTFFHDNKKHPLLFKLPEFEPSKFLKPIKDKITRVQAVLNHPNGLWFPSQVWQKVHTLKDNFFNKGSIHGSIYGFGQIGGNKDYPFAYRNNN